MNRSDRGGAGSNATPEVQCALYQSPLESARANGNAGCWETETGGSHLTIQRRYREESSTWIRGYVSAYWSDLTTPTQKVRQSRTHHGRASGLPLTLSLIISNRFWHPRERELRYAPDVRFHLDSKAGTRDGIPTPTNYPYQLT